MMVDTSNLPDAYVLADVLDDLELRAELAQAQAELAEAQAESARLREEIADRRWLMDLRADERALRRFR